MSFFNQFPKVYPLANGCYESMKILLTGASGFLGEHIFNELSKNHKVDTFGRKPTDTYISDLTALNIKIKNQYDLTIHTMGLAHKTPKSEIENEAFFKINVEGTRNFLNTVINKTKSFVFISSVAVYGRSRGLKIDETVSLLGGGAYADSKIRAENLVLEWGQKNDVNISILRLPLIVGENPKGNLLLMKNAIKSGRYFRVGKGDAKKSMVLAEDIAKIIPLLVNKGGIFNLTDGYHPSFMELEDVLAKKESKVIRSIPHLMAKIGAFPGDLFKFWPLSTQKLNKITSSLTFDDNKARKELGWKPMPVLDWLRNNNI
ncbi:MAG: nucleoside-diphosphate-sugar epimerase [Cyclobacteriaceae bacterium]|jgi:nucleoside-diphosphate-sugar epimerase